MARIDKATIDKIHDATNIVDVVGDFVSLKRRGSSYLGLCPFHNERTPSFSVSAARGIFKCFSCGKAGTAISFLMDLENMSYTDAIKWLGRKYNIEVKERELSTEEKAAEAERESLYAVNEFALKHFEDNLLNTDEGVAVGKSYFMERGISEAMIQKFHLGYALEQPDDLLKKAKSAGFQEKYLIDTGLEIQRDNGSFYDRFKGRVIYPIHSLSGRVVAFGGRTLRKEKTVAKYVNSPESIIYSKSNELYGMFQARNAIAKKKNCILVEGYMDVISMHQAGVENVVASSGTSLTDGQIRMIRRFADSVTLIYDSDPAGIKASLRGINMFISAGFSLKLVLLPEGDDPDSFAQNHTSSEVEEYIETHSQNLIGFKADILLKEAGNDPRARGEAINDILQTIALIPDIVEQSLYLDEFAKKTNIPASTLSAQLKKFIAQNAEKEFKKRQLEQASKTIETVAPETGPVSPTVEIPNPQAADSIVYASSVVRAEEEIINHVLRHGLLYMCDVYPDESTETPVPMSVVDYIECEFKTDGLKFSHPLYRQIWEQVIDIRDTMYPQSADETNAELNAQREAGLAVGLERIRTSGMEHSEIVKQEKALRESLDKKFNNAFDDFSANYIRNIILRNDDRSIIDTVARLTADPIVLSRMYPKVDVRAQILQQVPIAINTLKSAILKEEMKEILEEIAKPHTAEEFMQLQQQFLEKKALSMRFDKFNGEIVITPPSKQ